MSLLALKRGDEAQKEAQAVLTLSPGFSRAEYVLGAISMQKWDYSTARDCFARWLTQSPNDYAANYHLGVLAALEGKWDDGEWYFLCALKIDSNSAEAHNASLGNLYFQHARLD